MNSFYDDESEELELKDLSRKKKLSDTEEDSCLNINSEPQQEEEKEQEEEGSEDDFSIFDDIKDSDKDKEKQVQNSAREFLIENDQDLGNVQDQAILDSKEEEYTDPLKNDGFILDRNKIIMIIMAVVFSSLILIMCMPQKRKVKKNNELEKAGYVYIPSEVDRWTVENTEKIEKAEPEKPKIEIEFPEEYPEKKAPVEVPKSITSSTSAGSARPETNRDEQQKAPFKVDLNSRSLSFNNTHSDSGSNPGYSRTGTNAYSSTRSSQVSGYPQSIAASYLANQNASSYEKQNDQRGKEEFMNRAKGEGGKYQWNSEFSLWKGTVISAVLDTGINTDLPGVVKATVTTNVYSSNNGKYLLIPQGSQLIAEYNSSISYGQNRVQVAWNTLIRPDGLEIDLGNLNGVDAYGASGYKGFRTEHPFEYAKAIGLIAVFSILDTKANNMIGNSSNQYAQNALSDAYKTTKTLTDKIVDRALDVQPTIKIPAGKEIKLITNVTMDIPPLDPYPVEQRYIREY